MGRKSGARVRRKSKSNLLVEVVVRKSFIKLNFKETDRKTIQKPASYYASLICFGDVLNSAGKIAEAVIPVEEKEKFKKEFYKELMKVRETLNKTIKEDRYES